MDANSTGSIDGNEIDEIPRNLPRQLVGRVGRGRPRDLGSQI